MKKNLFLRINGLILVTASLIISGCSGFGTTEGGDEGDTLGLDSVDNLQLFEPHPLSASLDDYFSDFFYTFLTDEDFQKTRIDDALRDKAKNIARRFNAQEFYTVVYTDDQDLALQNDTALQEVSVSWIAMTGDVDRYVFRKNAEDAKWMLAEIDNDAKVSRENKQFFLFYRDFATDMNVQKESLQNPVHFVVSQSEESEEDAEMGNMNRDIKPEEWNDFINENGLPMLTDDIVAIDFGQKMESDDTKNLLLQEFSNGNTMIMRFKKESQNWKLCEIDV